MDNIIQRDVNGYWPNIEELLRQYVKTQDETLFNDVIYHYLSYLAVWEKKNHDTSLYDDPHLVHDMISTAAATLLKYDDTQKCTAQSWCRLAMKQYLMQRFNAATCGRRNVFQKVYIEDLPDASVIDNRPEEPSDVIEMADYIKRYDVAIQAIKFTPAQRPVVDVIRKILANPDCLVHVQPNKLTSYISSECWPDNDPAKEITRRAMITRVFSKIHSHITGKPLKQSPNVYRICLHCNAKIRYRRKDYIKMTDKRAICKACLNKSTVSTG